ncbi:MAG TPA: thiamine pyrophosphate-binding protein [Gemmataceae bacterium]|jgi:acetolactate synthase-1/2/3 large subunit|nr:thiamine pyrophosphate-binding protein [Gemmataceae bacterium]
MEMDRRTLFHGAAVVGGLLLASRVPARANPIQRTAGWIEGKMTGAMAVVETLVQEGCECVYGIPGAQENELWDAMKTRGLSYLLCTHEFSASTMADGYARATGKPGVLAVVPGPGVTNSLTGLGEALVDSIPLVAIVGDIAQGEKFRPFQVHCLDQVALLKPVTKGVFHVEDVGQIAAAIRKAFALASSGEPGPVAVVIPYTMLTESHEFHTPPAEVIGTPFDENCFIEALKLLKETRFKVGIYAGQGCMDYSQQLIQLAELLQAPVATSVSGKGCFPECHPLSVGWGYGSHATGASERVFANNNPMQQIELLLAIGVRFSEVSTGYYNMPKIKHAIHVDANPCNLGKVIKADVCVAADAGAFMLRCLEFPQAIKRERDDKLLARIKDAKADDMRRHCKIEATHGADPMAFLLSLRRNLPADGLVFVDVTISEHLAAEAFEVTKPRTYFNPTDNQAMGWSIPAALGAQKVMPNRPVAVVVGDGCFLMSAMEMSTAARENLPVKFFVLDDQAYHYMQRLQKAAYLRTTATILARMDYSAFAQAVGLHYCEINATSQLDAGIQQVLEAKVPVLTRVIVDYRDRKVRWIDAVARRYTREMTPAQTTRFLARIGSRAVQFQKAND